MNTPLDSHPLIGTEHVYRPYEPNMQHLTDSTYVVRNGDHVTVLEVFHDWNGVKGLTILWVQVHETGYRTHLSADEIMGTKVPA